MTIAKIAKKLLAKNMPELAREILSLDSRTAAKEINAATAIADALKAVGNDEFDNQRASLQNLQDSQVALGDVVIDPRAVTASGSAVKVKLMHGSSAGDKYMDPAGYMHIKVEVVLEEDKPEKDKEDK